MSTYGIQRDRPNKDRQVLQRTKRAPDELVKHIELANLIPPASQLPGYDEMSEKVYEILEGGALAVGYNAFSVYRLSLFKTIVTFLHGHLPPEKFPELYKYLGPIGSDRGVELFNRFRNVYGTRALFDSISAAQTNKADSPDKDIEIPREATPMSVALALDGEGKLKVERWPLLDALVGVEAGRIRRCSECPRIFWAGRVDKYACRDKCVNRRNVRLWREHYPESYKLQRVKKVVAAESIKINSQHKSRRKTR
jgi:hypothetical protein